MEGKARKKSGPLSRECARCPARGANGAEFWRGCPAPAELTEGRSKFPGPPVGHPLITCWSGVPSSYRQGLRFGDVQVWEVDSVHPRPQVALVAHTPPAKGTREW